MSVIPALGERREGVRVNVSNAGQGAGEREGVRVNVSYASIVRRENE